MAAAGDSGPAAPDGSNGGAGGEDAGAPASFDHLGAANKELAMLRRKLDEVVHQRNALHELMRRSQDLHILFDMEGRICYAGSESACSHILGRVSQSLFDEPLHKILAPGAQGAFEAYINHILEAQSVRELAPEERRVRTVLVDASGRQRHVEGHGQAWQRGSFIEFVYSFREIATLDPVPPPAPPVPAAAPAAPVPTGHGMGRPVAPGWMQAPDGRYVQHQPPAPPPAAPPAAYGPPPQHHGYAMPPDAGAYQPYSAPMAAYPPSQYGHSAPATTALTAGAATMWQARPVATAPLGHDEATFAGHGGMTAPHASAEPSASSSSSSAAAAPAPPAVPQGQAPPSSAPAGMPPRA